MKITLHHICYGYEPHNQVINEITGSFESGNFYSILGPNGSGKTTLLDLISGFLTPDTGHIEINGRQISQFTKNQLSRQIALVSQDYAINFPFQVKDVIMMGRHPYIPRFALPSDNDIKIVERMIDLCGIRHLMNRKINQLSGGERQRCVFARALCQDTPVLLLDEAFSSMDIHHTLQMLNLVKQQVKETNKTVISVFHDLNLASVWSDKLMLLKQGQIYQSGNSRDVLTREAVKQVFNVNALVTYNPDIHAKQVSYVSV
ncbi:MAG: ABC transporter ATP-binding protein [Pseudomonadota bacterium]